MLRNEPGALFLQCSLFLFLPSAMLCCAPFTFSVEVTMTQHDSVRAQLHAIEALLRQHQLWQETAPQPEAFASTQPFCLDTLAPFEWLQWVLIPRMHALLEGGHPLPQAFAVSPYYEMALEATHPARDVMLVELEKLDALFAGEDA
jgi:uncharacterized protein YqcC (DUF446 family)